MEPKPNYHMKTGRTTSIIKTHTFSSHIGRRLSAATRGAFLHLPAFFSACTPTPETSVLSDLRPNRLQIYIQQTEKTMVESLDLFFFEDDALGRLDAYQHFGAEWKTRTEGISCNGPRKVAAIANRTADPYLWSDIRTFGNLAGRTFSLAEEDPARPFLYGSTSVEAGSVRSCTLPLEPKLARIVLRSLCCDFSDRPYREAALEDIRFYLTHAAASCQLEDTRPPADWINSGHLDSVAVSQMRHPEMVWYPWGKSLSGKRVSPDIAFYTYPNPAREEAFGQPVTRLVIEGRILGTTYYYPVNLPELEANRQYELDITITRTGSSDPDIPVASGTVRLGLQVLSWQEREPETLHY